MYFPIIRQFLHKENGVGDGRGCPEKWGYRSTVDRGGSEGEWMVHSFFFLSPLRLFLVSSCLFPTPLFLVVISTPLSMQHLTGERSKAEDGECRASAAYRRDVNSSVVVERIRCSSKRECAVSLAHLLSPSLSLSLLLSAVS